MFTIKNHFLTVKISDIGGELQSIENNCGTEYLWQGDKKYWLGKAINLFPYIGRLTEGKYCLFGAEYKLDIHGFIKTSKMTVGKQESDSITFYFKDNAKTRRNFPYSFLYQIHYKLINNNVKITYEVNNLDSKTMYFGVGGHPGFNLPIQKGLDFSDYYLEFSQKHYPNKVGMSDDCYVNGVTEPFQLEEDRRLFLNHDLFSNDAIVLKDVDRIVTLKSNRDSKSVTVSFPQMDYLGLWHTPNTAAPFICIEPWSSCPSRKGVIEALEKQSDLISLAAGGVYTNNWGIMIT